MLAASQAERSRPDQLINGYLLGGTRGTERLAPVGGVLSSQEERLAPLQPKNIQCASRWGDGRQPPLAGGGISLTSSLHSDKNRNGGLSLGPARSCGGLAQSAMAGGWGGLQPQGLQCGPSRTWTRTECPLVLSDGVGYLWPALKKLEITFRNMVVKHWGGYFGS